jgi:hypothetical protein
LAYGLFKFKVSAAARALFSLGVRCGTAFVVGWKGCAFKGTALSHLCVKAEVNIFTFYLFRCVFKISITFIFYIAQLIFIITIWNLAAACDQIFSLQL